MLEHHRQAGAQQLQLLLVGHLQLAVFVAHHANVFVVQADRAFARLLEEVDAAQEGTFAGAGGADDADHVAGVGLQRDALQHFVVAVAFVQFRDG